MQNGSGALFLVNATAATTQPVLSRLSQVVRTDYSNPPMHGAKIVSYILGILLCEKLGGRAQNDARTDQQRKGLLCKKLERLLRIASI